LLPSPAAPALTSEVLPPLIIDVGEGKPEGFSWLARDDRHFIARSRVFSPDAKAGLAEITSAVKVLVPS
jgi:hypothetical protein